MSGVSGSAQYLVAQSAAHSVAMATLPGGRVHQVAVTALATPTNQPEQTVSTHVASYNYIKESMAVLSIIRVDVVPCMHG